jgi:hypothetical protein
MEQFRTGRASQTKSHFPFTGTTTHGFMCTGKMNAPALGREQFSSCIQIYRLSNGNLFYVEDWKV